MVYLLDQMSVPMDLLWHLHLQWQPPQVQLQWTQWCTSWTKCQSQWISCGISICNGNHRKSSCSGPNGVPLGPNVSPNGSPVASPSAMATTASPAAVDPMVYLLDQMSVPMDLLWHLHLQWQPPQVQLQWLQMVYLLVLVSLQMGTVALH